MVVPPIKTVAAFLISSLNLVYDVMWPKHFEGKNREKEQAQLDESTAPNQKPKIKE